MQTDPHAVRWLVTETGSKMAVRSDAMWIFDYESDAKLHILTNSPPQVYGTRIYQTYDRFRLYKVSPTQKPKKVFLTDKYLGVATS